MCSNKSEELARFLGIEPKEYFRPDDEIYWGSKQETMRDIDVIYPNFTKPNNFMKLLDLLNTYLDIRCDCLIPVVPQIIGKAIFLASTNSSRFIDKKIKFKQQAQQTEWEY